MRRIALVLIGLAFVFNSGCGGADNKAERPATETPLPTAGPSGLEGAGAPAPPPPPPLPK